MQREEDRYIVNLFVRLNVRTHYYFPIQFLALGYGLIIIGLLAAPTKLWLTPLCLSVGMCFSSTHFRLLVDFEERYYSEYIWLFGFKIGAKTRFDKAQYFYLTSAIFSYEYGPIAPRYFTDERKTQAYLKLDEDDKLFVGEGPLKKRIQKRMTKYATKFNLELLDLT